MIDILTSTKSLLNDLQFVTIHRDGVKELADTVKESDLHTSELSLAKYKWDMDKLQHISFVFDSINYCFWSEKGKEKWSVERDGEKLDGSIALFRCLEHEARSNPKFFDSKYLEELDSAELSRILEGNVEIPLLNERLRCVKEIGNVLNKNFEGDFNKLLTKTDNNAVTLLNIIIDNFPLFRDTQKLENNELGFYKRAQLQVKVVNDINVSFGGKQLDNLDKLTAFADYKIPQLLRALGIITYTQDLSQRIDEQVLLPKNSREEIEIRVATIWGVEYLKEELKHKYNSVTSSHIDSMLWNLSQKPEIKTKPYHRTYTTAY